MGDAGVAISSSQNGFFYNPAALFSPSDDRLQLHLLGARLDGTTNIMEQIDFISTDVQDAMDQGIDNMSQEELDGLYDRAREIGRKNTMAEVDALLPNAIVQLKELGIAVGGGVFAHSYAWYQLDNAGAGVPGVNMVLRADGQALLSGAIDLSRYGVDGLTAGLNAKYTRRYLTLKERPFDAMIEDNIYLFRGESVGFDLGLLYEIPVTGLPGKLQAGLATYDLLASDFDYSYRESLISDQPEQEVQIEAEKALADELYGLHPSFRAGVAFQLTDVPVLLDKTSFAVDYLGYASPNREQSALAHLHLGAQTRVANFLVLRAGLRQGYTTIGGGISLPFMNINYAYYGSEGGRYPGQVPSWHHTLQLSFGLL